MTQLDRDLVAEPTFRDRVYQLTDAIPPGYVMTYGQIARALGSPRAARIVGGAMAALPSDATTPYHRVVGAQGRIVTSYADANGNRQADRLRAEGVVVTEALTLDLRRYIWWPTDDALDAVDASIETRLQLDDWLAQYRRAAP